MVDWDPILELELIIRYIAKRYWDGRPRILSIFFGYLSGKNY